MTTVAAWVVVVVVVEVVAVEAICLRGGRRAGMGLLGGGGRWSQGERARGRRFAASVYRRVVFTSGGWVWGGQLGLVLHRGVHGAGD